MITMRSGSFINPDPKNEKFLAWKIYSIVTDLYQSNPSRMRDWISQPRSTGYESLHLTVMSPDKKWIEVQIRSERMDDIAEKGVAAHYKYKEGYRKNSDDQRFESWVSESVRSWNSNRIFLHRNCLTTSNSIFIQKKYLFLRQKVRSKFCQSALQLWILLSQFTQI